MMLTEHFLKHMKAAVGIDETFDRGDLGAIRLCHEHGAGLHRLPIQIDGASAAMASGAPDMRAGKRELFTQKVDQQGARLGQTFDLAIVDFQFDVHLGHLCRLP
jgi:hypothetical protein